MNVHEPVRVGGIMIQPGDLLHGDRNGVTTIPVEIASEVAALCADYMNAEALVLNYLKNVKVTPQGFTEARDACKAKLDEMARQVRNKS